MHLQKTTESRGEWRCVLRAGNRVGGSVITARLPIPTARLPLHAEPIPAARLPLHGEPIPAARLPLHGEPILTARLPLHGEPILTARLPLHGEMEETSSS